MTRSLLVTGLALLAFIVPAFFIDADSMTEGLSAAVFIAAGLGAYRWGPAAVRVYAAGAHTEAALGIIGLVLILVAEMLKRVYAVTFIVSGRPDFWTTLHISPFLTYATLIGFVLMIMATRFEGERPSHLPGALAAIFAFLGVMFSAALPLIMAKLSALGMLLARL